MSYVTPLVSIMKPFVSSNKQGASTMPMVHELQDKEHIRGNLHNKKKAHLVSCGGGLLA